MVPVKAMFFTTETPFDKLRADGGKGGKLNLGETAVTLNAVKAFNAEDALRQAQDRQRRRGMLTRGLTDRHSGHRPRIH